METKTHMQSNSFTLTMRLLVVAVMALIAGLLVAAQPASADGTTTPFTCPDGSTPQDTTGDGVVDERDCEIDVVDPDQRGRVTVKAGCGFIRVTNREDSVMRFRYGRSHHKLNHLIKVAPGATRKVKTTIRRVEWKASWRTKDARVGDNLRVRQSCGSSSVKPTVTPTALPNTGA